MILETEQRSTSYRSTSIFQATVSFILFCDFFLPSFLGDGIFGRWKVGSSWPVSSHQGLADQGWAIVFSLFGISTRQWSDCAQLRTSFLYRSLMVPAIVPGSSSRYQTLKHISYNLECSSQMRRGSFWTVFKLPNTLRGTKKIHAEGAFMWSPHCIFLDQKLKCNT